MELSDQAYASNFGTFLCDCEAERNLYRTKDKTVIVSEGRCHCPHVEALIFKIEDLDGRMEDMGQGEASNDSTISAHFSANTKRREGRARVQ